MNESSTTTALLGGSTGRAQSPAPAPRGVLRWAPVGLFALLVILLCRHAGDGISDPDTLWHILAGDHLRQTWQFVGPDPLSTFTVHPWVLTQWLPELAMSLAHQWGGLPAVALLLQLFRLAVCVAIYWSCRRSSGPLASAVVTGVTLLATTASLSPRPQLVGFALLAVSTAGWMATVGDLRPRWWLIPVTWVWACSHGTWVVGVLLGLATVLGLTLDRRLGTKHALALASVVVGSGIAAMATPLGPRLLETFSTVREVSPFIDEWRRPGLTEPSTLALAVMTLFVLVGLVLRRPQLTWTHGAFLVTAVVWGFSTSRGVALGAIIIAPLAARLLEALLGRARPRAGAEPTVVACVVGVAVMLCAAFAAGAPRVPVGVPSGLIPQLSALSPGTVVYNDDALGGWLMWHFPALRQTADTRWELYGASQAKGYLRVMSAEPGWEADLNALQPDVLLLRRGAPVAAIAEKAGWSVLGGDHGFVLLRE